MSTPSLIECASAVESAETLVELVSRAAANARSGEERFCMAFSPSLLATGLFSIERAAINGRFAHSRALLVSTEMRWDAQRFARAFRVRCRLLQAGLDPGLLLQVPVGERDPGKAALSFEQSLRAAFSLRDGYLPRFALVLLHRAEASCSGVLRPRAAALSEVVRIAVADYDPRNALASVSLTWPVICNAARVVLVSDSDEPACGDAAAAPSAEIPDCLASPRIANLTVLRTAT